MAKSYGGILAICGKIVHFSPPTKTCIASYAYVLIAKWRVKQQNIEIEHKGRPREGRL